MRHVSRSNPLVAKGLAQRSGPANDVNPCRTVGYNYLPILGRNRLGGVVGVL